MTNIRKAFLVAILLLLYGVGYCQSWQPLFNGKNLDGWSVVGDSATFTVEEGAIRLHRKANTPEHTFLRTDKKYRDFILEMECRRDEQFYYGILVRAVPAPDTAHARLYGYQVKVDHQKDRRWTGAIFDDYGNTWRWLSTLSDNPKAQNALKEAGLWDHYRFELIGDHIKVWVNGVDASSLVNTKYKKGYIALKIHFLGDNVALEKPTAWVRNIRIITKHPARYTKAIDIQKTVVE
ncbi:DUF1080 domain-containing protein [Persicitalea sp.]|uniref:3-keto-disaccharide hydrolase n=1 Tax=Persicitalea sp. TaxID=3100273 RepID=UPI003593ADBA